MRITFAIPTYNRVSQLKIALASIERQVIPKGLSVSVAISNSHSIDGTTHFLNNIRSRFKMHIFNVPGSRAPNWFSLTKVVPKCADFIWMMGDDDLLTSKYSLRSIFDVIKDNLDADLFLVPMNRRVPHQRMIQRDTLMTLCNQHSYHEMLGWISGLIIRRHYFQLGMKKYTRALGFVSSPPKVMVRKKVGHFIHAQSFFSILHNRTAVLCDINVITEQKGSDRALSTVLARDGASKRFHSQRFFFDIGNILSFTHDNGLKTKPSFFKYVNKGFHQLLFDIYIEGALTGLYTKAEMKYQENLLMYKSKYLVKMSIHGSFIKQVKSVAAHSRQLINIRERLGAIRTMNKARKLR